MKSGFRNKPLIFGIPVSLLIIIASVGGLLFRNIYSRETAYVVAQASAQDAIDIVIVVPVLLIASYLVSRGKKSAYFIWFGTMLYVVYNFVIYSFGIHFNGLFLVYCFTLGLSFYSIISVVAGRDAGSVKEWFDEERSNSIISAYLWIIALVFFSQWLGEVIPAIIRNDVPRSVKDAGTFTSAVHVLDLSIFLPGMAISAALLRRRQPLGYLFAPSFAVFGALTGFAIAAMIVSIRISGLQVDLRSLVVFTAITLISVVVLLEFLNHIKKLPNASA